MSENTFRPRFNPEHKSHWVWIIDYVKSIGFKKAKKLLSGAENVDSEDLEYRVKTENKDDLTVDTYSARLRTEKDIIDFHEIDLNYWEKESCTTNYWEQGAKIPDGSGGKIVLVTPLHQIKLKFKKIVNNDVELYLKELKAELLKSVVIKKRCNRRQKSSIKGHLAVELMITDLHLGKVGFNTKTLELNWDLETAKKTIDKVIDDLLFQIDIRAVDHFILPVGNDLLNIDNSGNTTTRGTPQMTGVFWQNLFRYGTRLVTDIIAQLAELKPVYVYFVPGNHDAQSIFSMGEIISATFKKDDNVHIDNTPILRKYHKYGKCLIGYSHGNNIAAKSLHNTMAIDRPQDFGKTKYRAFHIGHKHKNNKREFILIRKDEEYGLDVEICPSLSPTDSWHYKNLYDGNLRRSKCFVWHKSKGNIQEIYFNL